MFSADIQQHLPADRVAFQAHVPPIIYVFQTAVCAVHGHKIKAHTSGFQIRIGLLGKKIGIMIVKNGFLPIGNDVIIGMLRAVPRFQGGNGIFPGTERLEGLDLGIAETKHLIRLQRFHIGADILAAEDLQPLPIR